MTSRGQVDIAGLPAPATPHPSPLATELSFLLDQGVPSSLLRQAMDIARDAGVEPVEALLAHGLVDEDTFYRALARTMQLPFLPQLTAGPGAVFPQSIEAGLIPLDPAHGPLRFAHAPKGLHVARLLAGPPIYGSLAITTPTALRDAVIAINAPSIAAQAADTLPNAAPALSFRGGATPRQRLALKAAFGALCLFLVIDFVSTMVLALGLISILCLALANIRITACFQSAPVQPREAIVRRADMDLPVYTVVVPLYREANVVEALRNALLQLDYPLARLDIKLMTEEDDAQTQEALRALALPGAFEIIVVPKGEPRTKPRALNVALPLARGEFLVVYDAEDEPEHSQLRHAVETFAAQPWNVCCLQAR
ncbi:MAG TPA: glycosyltransferase, partial [Saliniramus sp.]|nr:glycosyltransferase [Saliniramus sp.]